MVCEGGLMISDDLQTRQIISKMILSRVDSCLVNLRGEMGRWMWKLINDFGFRYRFLCKPCVRWQNSHKLENLQHPYSVFPLVRIEQHLNRYLWYSAYTGMLMTHNSYSTEGSSAILV